MGVSVEDLDDKISYRGLLEASPARIALTVSDAIKLATAGIKIEFDQIRSVLVPDPPEKDKISTWWDTVPTKALIARIAMNARSRPRMIDDFQADAVRMFQALLVTQHGDMAHVFVHYRGCEPQVMTDPMHLFPSDALMAQLYLLEEHAKTHMARSNP